MFAYAHACAHTRALANMCALTRTMQDENRHVRNQIARDRVRPAGSCATKGSRLRSGGSQTIRRHYHTSLCDIPVGAAPRSNCLECQMW